MSAFVVNKSHINAIIQAGLNVRYKPFTWYHKEDGELQQYKLTSSTADEVGQMLIDECIHSVRYRYEDSELSDLPGPINAEYLMPFAWKSFVRMPTPIEAIKAIHCLEYQSCEHPEWDTSNAHDFCQALRDTLESQIPGWDEAPWEWEDQEYYNATVLKR